LNLLLTALLLVAPMQEQPQVQRAILELVVNEVVGGEVRVYLIELEIWVRVDDLAAAGLADFEGTRREFDAVEHVELGSEPDFSAEVDMSSVSLRLTAHPRFFETSRIEMVDPRPKNLEFKRSTSAFLNYSAQWNSSSGTDFFGEANFSFAGNSATSTFSVDDQGNFRRGISNLIVDEPDSLRRWAAGDVFGRGGLLGSSPFVGGLRVGREYSLDPYYSSYATPQFAGATTTPSTVEVFIDGQPAQRFQLPPGPFQLDRLPVTAGLGVVSVVVRDAFGREQVFDSRYYLSTQVLKKGEQDYEYLAGAEREDNFEDGISYGDWVGTAKHRVGITDSFTLGVRAEGGERVFNAGPLVNLVLPKAGEIEFQAAASTADEGSGYAASATYFFTAPRFSFNGFARWQGDGYADLFLEPLEPRDTLLIDAVATIPVFSRGSFSLGYRQDDALEIIDPDGTVSLAPVGVFSSDAVQHAVQRTLVGRLSYRLLRFAQVSGTATYNRTENLDFWEGYVSVAFLIGRRTSASIGYEQRQDTQRTVADINRSLPAGPGFGYRLQGSDDRGGTGTAELVAQRKFARFDARYDVSRDGNGVGTVGIAGALVAIGGRAELTRPVTGGSYALVRLPDVSGVEVFANHQSMGTTRRNGTVFVPDLLAYHANSLSYRDTDVPMDYIIGETERQIAPPFRGGAVIEFPLRRLHAFTGTLRILQAGEEIVPEYADLVLLIEGVEQRSPLNGDGHFYLQNIPAGVHPAQIMFRGELCGFDLEIPETNDRVSPLGTITCSGS
jgi:outer membrane usher protein